MLSRKEKAQSTLEYAIIIAVVVGALLAMQTYIKRGIQGKLQASTDSIGEQYSAGITTVKYITQDNGPSETKERFGTGEGFSDDIGNKGVSHTEITQAAQTTRSNREKIETVTKKLKDEQLFSPQGSLFDE